MGEIVNLRLVKKRRARDAAVAAAAENRIRHGRTAARQANEHREQQRRREALDGARNEGDPQPDPSTKV